MTDDKKKQLFPYFAYLYSQELNPEKYGEAESIEEWTELIQDSPEDVERISEAAAELSDEEWAQLEEQYASAEESPEDVETAKKGAKLKKLQEFKKGAKMGKKKKCACGCDLITKKEKGGTLVDECTCCGEVHKFQSGGVTSWRTVANYGGSQGDPRFLNFISRIFSRENTSKSSGNVGVKQNPQTQWEKNARTYSQEEVRNMPGYVGRDLVVTASPAPASASQTNEPTVNTNTAENYSDKTDQISAQKNGPPTAGAPSSNVKRVPSSRTTRPVYKGSSVVDYLNSKGQGSSFSDRSRLADSLGIRNYTGSASQNLDLLAMLQKRPRAISDLKANLVHTPNITSPSEADLAFMQSKRVPTTVAANRKGGLIKKAQKGTKTKEKYIGNHETWDPKSVGTGDNSMNPKDWSPEKKKADREAWLNRNKKVTKKPVPSKKEVGLPKKK